MIGYNIARRGLLSLFEKKHARVNQIKSLSYPYRYEKYLPSHPSSLIRFIYVDDQKFELIGFDFSPIICSTVPPLYRGNLNNFLTKHLLQMSDYWRIDQFGIDALGNLYKMAFLKNSVNYVRMYSVIS